MKLNQYGYEILNFPVDSFVVSKRGVSTEKYSCALSALNELYECSIISREELDECLSTCGLISTITSDF